MFCLLQMYQCSYNVWTWTVIFSDGYRDLDAVSTFFFISVILFYLETEDIQHILNKRVAEEILEIINKID